MKLIFILITALMLTGCAVADAKPSAPIVEVVEVVEPEITEQDIEILKESCVMIYASDENSQVQGSAVAIGENRYLTAYHVIADGRTNVKTSDGEKLTIESYSEELDIMVLTSEKKAVPVKIGDVRDSRVGDEVVIIGSPDGNNDTVIHTTIKGILEKIVVDGTSGGGSSGGGMFNMKGELIGIVIGGDEEKDETHAVSLDKINRIL